MSKGKGLGLLVLGEPEKGDSKSESKDEETGKAAMSAASSAAMGAVKRNDADAFQKAMRELFHAFMMAGPPKK